MDMQEILKLKKKYSDMSDEELKGLLSEGKCAYREGIYELIEAEAMRRGINEEKGQDSRENEAFIPAVVEEAPLEKYLPIMVVVDYGDKESLEETLNKDNIPYFFDTLSLKGNVLPASLAVEESKVERAISLLKDFKPKGGIVLW